MITTATINDATGIVQIVEGGNSHRHHVTTMLGLGQALLASYEERTGAVVATTPAAGVEWIDLLATNGVAVGRSGATDYILATIPPTSYDIQLGTVAYYSIPFPALFAAMACDRTTRRLHRSCLYVLDPAAPVAALSTASTAPPCLATFPYANVYSSTGLICWGSVPATDITTIPDLITTFFRSGFNADLCHIEGGFNAACRAIRDKTATTLPAPSTYPIRITHAMQQIGAR